MPHILTHDLAIAQKEKPHTRRHHNRSRSEDEKKLTIATDLPAETTLLPCTPLATRKTGLRFSSPKRRPLKIDSSHDRTGKSGNRFTYHNQENIRGGPVMQSPEKVGEDRETMTSNTSSSDGYEILIETYHARTNGSFRHTLTGSRFNQKPCCKDITPAIRSVSGSACLAATLVQSSECRDGTQQHTTEGAASDKETVAAPPDSIIVRL